MWKKNSFAVKSLFAALTVVLVLTCICSCGREALTEPDCDDSVTFTDALGREVTVSRATTRVAALIGSFAEVWQLAGGDLVASADDAWDDFALDMGEAVNLGGTKAPSVELLLSAEPELVIASASTAANVEMLDTLVSAGITVAYFDVSTFEDYLSMLKICTDITGRSDLYEKNGTDVEEHIAEIKSSFDNEDISVERRTVLFLRASAGYIRAKNSEGSILGEMLKDVGCINIADNDSTLLEALSIESIVRQDPYRIFIVQVGDDADAVRAGVEAMMTENPAWTELSAVKNGRIHYMDKRLFNLKPNALWGRAYEILCDILESR